MPNKDYRALLECPFCGGEARIRSRYIGYGSIGLGAHDWYTVECNGCHAKSNECGKESDVIAAWNRRHQPENKPLSLDALREMDGAPVYVQCGDGLAAWAVVCWDSPTTLFLYGPAFDPIFEPDLDFINMEYNDPDGYFGLHILGWRVLHSKPKEE